MDMLRIGEALLRHNMPVRFLRPIGTYHRAATSKCKAISQPSLQSRTPSHAFGTSTRMFAESNTSTRSTKAHEERDETDELSRIMSNSFGAPQGSRSSKGFADEGPKRGGNSVSDMMLAAIGPVGKNRNRRDNFSSNSSDFDVDRMLNPNSNMSSLGSSLAPIAPDAPLPFKLGPSVGRMIPIDASRNMDVGRAFRQLEIVCNRNKVRSDFTRQRFHERPGLKRKRLKTLRWRRRFKESFRGIVKKVVAMKKQGW